MDHDSLSEAKKKHKEMFYNFLTEFAHLDTRIAYCVASHFANNQEKRIEITDLIISELNSQKQFDIFLRILRRKGINEIKVCCIEKLYSGVRKLRNLLAHSYLVPTNNTNLKGNGIKLTTLSDSKGKGYTKDLDANYYVSKKADLHDLLGEVAQITNDHFKLPKRIQAS